MEFWHYERIDRGEEVTEDLKGEHPMRTTNTCISLLMCQAAVWVSGCASQAEQAVAQPATATAATAIPAPLFPGGLDWKPGPVCTYDGAHNGNKARWNFTVAGVDGDTIRGAWSRDAGGQTVSIPVVKTQNGLAFTEDMSVVHGTPMAADPGYQWVSFPLEPGKSWQGRSVVSGTTAANAAWKVDVAYTTKVGQWEKLRTPVGETDALRVVSDEKIVGLSGNFSGTARTTVWMGPGACSVKKLEYKNSFRETGSMILVAESAQ